MAIENPMSEITEHEGVGRTIPERSRQLSEYLVRNWTVVERVHLQQPIATRNKSVFSRGRTSPIHDRMAVDALLLQIAEHKILSCVSTKNCRELDTCTGAA